MGTFYRVHWYLPDAKFGEPGHPMHVSNYGLGGRVDSKDYDVMYVADTPACAIAETLENFNPWSAAVFDAPPYLPGAARAITEYQGDVRVLDLNDAKALYNRRMIPSRVVTRNRKITQAWAGAIYSTEDVDGVKWWSYHDPDWAAVGLWRWQSLDVTETTVLDVSHFAFQEARGHLNRPWVDRA